MLKYAHKQQSTQCFSQTETHCKIPLLTKIISTCKVVIGESMSRVDAAPQAFVCGAFRCRSSAVILSAILQRKGTEQQRSVPSVKEGTPSLRYKKCASFRSFGRGTKRKQTPSDSTPARLRASRRL